MCMEESTSDREGERERERERRPSKSSNGFSCALEDMKRERQRELNVFNGVRVNVPKCVLVRMREREIGTLY